MSSFFEGFLIGTKREMAYHKHFLNKHQASLVLYWENIKY